MGTKEKLIERFKASQKILIGMSLYACSPFSDIR